jgi:phage repressor protein C with HTH and peptisase S24 domain
MEKAEKLQILNECYAEAVRAGRAKTRKEFANLYGINPSSLSAAFNGDDKYLTDNLIGRLMKDMPLTPAEIEQEMVLVIPTGARAGTLAEFADSIAQYDCERMVTPVKGADYAIQVTGDSMSPEYPSGSVVLIKRINEKAFVEWGKTYVLDTENGAVIKNVRRTDNPEVVECVSLNPAYQPFTMETKYINGWYRVLMVLSLK